jgi:hypothetical protein
MLDDGSLEEPSARVERRQQGSVTERPETQRGVRRKNSRKGSDGGATDRSDGGRTSRSEGARALLEQSSDARASERSLGQTQFGLRLHAGVTGAEGAARPSAGGEKPRRAGGAIRFDRTASGHSTGAPDLSRQLSATDTRVIRTVGGHKLMRTGTSRGAPPASNQPCAPVVSVRATASLPFAGRRPSHPTPLVAQA